MNELIHFKKNDVVNTLPEEELQKMAVKVFQDQLSDEEIAKAHGMSKPTFYRVKRTERFQKVLKHFGEIAVREANTKIQAASNKAVETLIKLLGSHTPTVQLKAATEILRLSGLGQSLPVFTSADYQNHDKALILQYVQSIALSEGKELVDGATNTN